MAERRDAGGGADVPDGEGVISPRVRRKNLLTRGGGVCYDTIRVQETAPSCGEMSEWLKEPVLKTGGAQVPVGSNPTLSANFLKLHQDTRKYPSGRRGSPAKGVGWIKPARGFKSLLPRQLGNSPYRSVSRPQGGKLRRTGNFLAFSREPQRSRWRLSRLTDAAPPCGGVVGFTADFLRDAASLRLRRGLVKFGRKCYHVLRPLMYLMEVRKCVGLEREFCWPSLRSFCA